MPIVIIAGTDDEIKAGKAQTMLTRTQAAARLGVTERRIKEFVDNADLTPYEERLFHIPLFAANDVEELRQSRLKRY
jgi:DNA polymerase III delta subunit